jgi:predicted enzyme related to lactoylglutathione lyase
MVRALGIGGVFFRSRDPGALAAWYADQLGIPTMVVGDHEDVWQQEAGPTVFSPFPNDTHYFGRIDQQVMLSYRVGDLDATLAQLRDGGAAVDERIEVMEGIGRFGWATDPEGNRFELWEPAEGASG